MGKNLTISICNIVKNEKNQIGGFLEHLSDFADEIVIVDTGSTDSTLEIVESAQKINPNIKLFRHLTDTSFHYGAAKNFSLGNATRDYCVVLDTDERLSNGFKQNIRKFLADENPLVASVVRKDAILPHLIDYPERIIKRDSGIRYGTDEWSRVHEQLSHSEMAKKFQEVIWHHQKENHYILRPQRIFYQLELQVDRIPRTKSFLGHTLRGVWYFCYRFKKIYVTKKLYKDGRGGFKYAFMRALDAFLIEFFVGLKP